MKTGGVSLFGIRITDCSRTEFIETMVAFAKIRSKRKVYNVNINALNIAYELPRFRNALRDADFVFNDGYGVCVAARVLGMELRSRHTVDDWMDELLAAANAAGLRVYLLGDEEQVIAKAAAMMVERHSGLLVAGFHHGFFEKTGPENDTVIAAVNAGLPHILLVGMSMPTQEFWIEANCNRVNANVFVPVGAAFRWYCGMEKRAPKWVTDNGFEWLARLAQHPFKLFRRYVIGNPLLFWRLLKTYGFKRGLPVESKG